MSAVRDRSRGRAQAWPSGRWGYGRTARVSGAMSGGRSRRATAVGRLGHGAGPLRARPNPALMTLNGTNTWLIAEPGSAVGHGRGPRAGRRGAPGPGPGLAAAGGPADRQASCSPTGTWTTRGRGPAWPPDRRAGDGRGPGAAARTRRDRLGSEGLSAPGDTRDVLTGGCELRVVATPGTLADSVCLLLPADGALLTGDTVLGRGTTVIAGDGSLADYLASWTGCGRSPTSRAAHAAAGPRAAARRPGWRARLLHLAHRRERLAEMAARAGRRGPDRRGDRGPRLRGCGPSLWPFARWSVRAQLDYLASRGELPPRASAPDRRSHGVTDRRSTALLASARRGWPLSGPAWPAGPGRGSAPTWPRVAASPGRRSRRAPCSPSPGTRPTSCASSSWVRS